MGSMPWDTDLPVAGWTDVDQSPGTGLLVQPLEHPPEATVVVPGSKSITNRALVAAAMAEGRSELRGALVADDTTAMASCLRSLGATVEQLSAESGDPATAAESGDPATAARMGRQRSDLFDVRGCAGRLAQGPVDLDARLSGTTARFLMPLLAAGPGPYLLDGGSPLRARPMTDGIAATRALGGVVVEERGAPGHLPVLVRPSASGTDRRAGGSHDEVVVRGDVSSQFLSGLLLAAPLRAGGLTVTVEGELVSKPYVAMTLAVMADFGVVAEISGSRYSVAPGAAYGAARYDVEPDASAASYFFAAAAICGGTVEVRGLSRGSLQGDLAFVEVLQRMGAAVRWGPDSVTVEGSGRLEGIEVDMRDLSDTAPTLAVTAVFASTPTRVTGIGFVRGKETDRIGSVVAELRRCGIEAAEADDGFVVQPGEPRPARIRTYDDHRMAMSFALLGLRAPGIEILDPHCVEKTFPGYFDALEQLRTRRS